MDTFVTQYTDTMNISFNTSKVYTVPLKFTAQDTLVNGSMPFLDILVKPEHNATLTISVYREPTHPHQ